MKYFGDIPIEHLELLKELEFLEELVSKHINDFPVLALAKGYTCIAHDYYKMDMEEEGERFLNKAEACAPGYFKGPIYVDMAKDELFSILMEQFKNCIGYDYLKSLGFNDNE